MVLATDITMPMTRPCPGGQPSARATTTARPIDSAGPSVPPISATPFTRCRSLSENSRPTQNISSTTPISAKASKLCASATAGPGVKGLMAIPPMT